MRKRRSASPTGRRPARRFGQLAAALAAAALVSSPLTAAANKATQSSQSLAVVSAGNDIYTVYVQDAGADLGKYTATTGPLHPAGDALNILFEDVGTSADTIRSYTTGTNYTQTALAPYGSVATLGATGFRTTYTLPSTAPDQLTVVSDVKVNGTTLADSSIQHTTRVTNNGTEPVSIGVRYLWDFEIVADDGPTFQQVSPFGPVLFSETQFTAPTFESYRIVDNDQNPTPPTFDVFGSVAGPATLSPVPTPPTLLQYACWSDAFPTAFDYSITPGREVAYEIGQCSGEGQGGDAAVNYYWGHNSDTAITIQPTGSASVTAHIFHRSIPTAVRALSFTARRLGKAVVLRWRTGSEAGLAGFDVYRGGTRLNRTLIPAAGGVAGHVYRLRLTHQPAGARYRLRAISTNGARAWLSSART